MVDFRTQSQKIQKKKVIQSRITKKAAKDNANVNSAKKML